MTKKMYNSPLTEMTECEAIRSLMASPPTPATGGGTGLAPERKQPF